MLKEGHGFPGRANMDCLMSNSDTLFERTTSHGSPHHRDGDEGFALLLVTFVIALATIIVMEFTDEIESFQRSSRSYSEQVQATLMLKSAVNLAKLLIEAPKPDDTKDEDWLYEAWNNIGSVPSIPLEGLIGELRLAIVDEDGKIDLNAIQGFGGSTPGPGGVPVSPVPIPGQQGQTGTPLLDNTSYWRNTLKELFTNAGFGREQYQANQYRTLGNVGYEAADQVAVIADWMDRDHDSFQLQGFTGNGVEGQSDRAWYYNRPLKSLAELAMVPGMTLERVQRIAPFVRVSQSVGGISNAVNINTAPYEVLVAMGFQPGDAEAIVTKRLSAPYTKDILPTLTAGDQNLANRLKAKSGEFSAYARVIMPTRTFWVRAVIAAQQAGAGRKALVRTLEFY